VVTFAPSSVRSGAAAAPPWSMKSPSPNASSTKIPIDGPVVAVPVLGAGVLGAAPPQAVTAHSRAAEQMAAVQFRAFGCMCGFLACSGG
jgi:hypothetical protein